MPRTFAVALFPAFLSFLLPGTLGSLNVETSTSQENCHKLVLFEELKKIDGHFLREFNYYPALPQQDELDDISKSFLKE